MALNIENKNTYVNQTATADIETRHYDLDYQVHYQSGEATLVYLNATFSYGTDTAEAAELEEQSTVMHTATFTWGQGMLQLPRAVNWDSSLWQNLKDFSEIYNSVQSTIKESLTL